MSFYVKIQPNNLIKVINYTFQYIGIDLRNGKLLVVNINKPLNEGFIFIDPNDIKRFGKAFHLIEKDYPMQYNYFEVRNKFPTCSFSACTLKFDEPLVAFENYK